MLCVCMGLNITANYILSKYCLLSISFRRSLVSPIAISFSDFIVSRSIIPAGVLRATLGNELMRMGCDLFKCCFTSTSSETFPEGIRLKWTIFSYRELAKATNNFDQHHCLEKRSFAAVYYGKFEDGREIAVQRFYEAKHQVFRQFIEEATILNYLPHKNLVSVYGCTLLDNESLLVHEYLSSGNLASHFQGEIEESSTIPWLTRLDIAIDAANALYYLHSYGIIHRDVKSSNILLDKNFCAKIANFHLARKLPKGPSVIAAHVTSDIIGTCGYIDPEYVSHGRLSLKNDVYSFGVVLCELISSKLAKHWVWSEEDSLANLMGRKIENQALDELLDLKLGFQFDHKIKQMITAVAELAVQCLQCPQVQRPHMEQVLDTLQGIKEGRYEIKPIKAFKIFHLDELEEATNHFDTCLGRGGFGAVYYGKLEDGREVAVKRFHEESDKIINQFRKEIDILSLLYHHNLVLLYGCTSRHNNKHLLVYEYISNGTLSMHLHGSSSGNLSWLTRLNIAIETAIALVYLHNSGIIHRDVKASNILLNEDFTVKVADFGLSRSLPNYVTHVSTNPAGTYAYIDPDYYETGRVSNKSDVYSFGVVLFELISSKPPRLLEGAQSVTLAKYGVSKILNKALEELVDPCLGFDSDKNVTEMITAVAELAFQCVQCPKDLRPSMNQVLETLEGIKKGTWGFNQIT